VTTSRTNPGVGPLLRVLDAFQAEGKTDGQLLREFLARRDEAAFAVLVRRHGPMVYGVCRRVLGNVSDAEDAFQAVFLVLARKAASLAARPVVGDWLHGVARRTALSARRTDARRRAREQKMARPEIQAAEERNDWMPLLDEELGRLPPIYQQTLILCDLEGKTRKEAARQLGIPEGTVATRLTRGRSLLARRLARRGVEVSGVTLATVLGGETSSGVAAPLVAATTRAATFATTGGAVSSGLISARVALLTEGVLKAMLLSKLTRMTLAVMLVAILALGAGLLDYHPALGRPLGQERRGNELRVSPEIAAHLGVRTVEATSRGGKPLVLRQVGTLNFDNDVLFSVRSRFPGEVTAIAKVKDGEKTRPLRYGDKVKKGQLLAVLTSRDLGERKAALVDALCKLHLSQATLDRLRKLWEEGALPKAALNGAEKQLQADANARLTAERTLRMWKVTDEEVQELRHEIDHILKNAGKRDAKKEARWARVEIRAPADGTVVEKNAHVGDVHYAGSAPLFKIADLSRLQIHVHPPEEYLSLIREGLKPGKQLKWQISFPSDPSNTPPLELNIHQIAPGPDSPRPMLIGFLDNPEGKYLIGQFVSAAIHLTGQEPNKAAPPANEVTVPASALVEQAGAAFVLVQLDLKKPVFEERRVVVVRRGSDVVHVRSRLNAEQERQGFQIVRPGEQVVTAGAIELKAALDDLKSKDNR
jgi:RNA polymerase sigma factor (sigma-70 family)